MGYYCDAEALAVGDVFRCINDRGPRRDMLKVVTGIRTVVYVETYRIVQYLPLDPEHADFKSGEMFLRKEIQVEKMAVLPDISHAISMLSHARPGTRVTVWAGVDGVFHA